MEGPPGRSNIQRKASEDGSGDNNTWRRCEVLPSGAGASSAVATLDDNVVRELAAGQGQLAGVYCEQ
jgi:hypothetical protein